MPKKVRTAKGSVIDFDLFKIKQQMGNVPKTVDVKTREDFIERKLRRLRRKAEADAKKKAAEEAGVVTEESTVVTEDTKAAAPKRKLPKKEKTTDEGSAT